MHILKAFLNIKVYGFLVGLHDLNKRLLKQIVNEILIFKIKTILGYGSDVPIPIIFKFIYIFNVMNVFIEQRIFHL